MPGASIVEVTGALQDWPEPLIHSALFHLLFERGRPYAIPAGASDHKLGGLGFANWAALKPFLVTL